MSAFPGAEVHVQLGPGLKLERDQPKVSRAIRPRFRILVISEATTERDRYAKALQSGGYTTLQAAAIDEACRLVEELRPDAILFDAGRPGIEAIEGLDRLSAVSRTAAPLITLVGGAGTLMRSGPTTRYVVVAKPCTPDALTALIDDLMQRDS